MIIITFEQLLLTVTICHMELKGDTGNRTLIVRRWKRQVSGTMLLGGDISWWTAVKGTNSQMTIRRTSARERLQ